MDSLDEKTKPLNPSSQNPLDVLLVEDNPGDARLIEKSLETADERLIGEVSITQTGNLGDATREVDQQRFSAVLLDLGLPDSSGLQTLRRFLAHTSRLPIVILTGLTDREIAYRAVSEGAEDFLHKDELGGERLARSLLYAIERHKRKLHTDVIESAELALLLVESGGADARVVFANQACEKLTGYDISQWQSGGLSLLHGNETDEDSIRLLDSVAKRGERQSVELRSHRDDGSWFWNRVQAIPLTDLDERMTHVLYSFEDVTDDLKWRAKLVDLDRIAILGNIAGGIAHEINNPLSFVTSNVQYVLRALQDQFDGPDEEFDRQIREALLDALEDAMEGSRRVQHVVDDLRQLAGDSDVETEIEPVSVSTIVERTLTIARNHVRERAELVCELRDCPKVAANPAKLGQVFLNILINATQAIPPGNPASNEVHVSTYVQDGEVVVAVADTGSGLPDDELERLFEPFFSTKEDAEGTGLGMSISKQIVNEFDGRIEVDTVVEEGTTVSIVLPAVEPEFPEGLGQDTIDETDDDE